VPLRGLLFRARVVRYSYGTRVPVTLQVPVSEPQTQVPPPENPFPKTEIEPLKFFVQPAGGGSVTTMLTDPLGVTEPEPVRGCVRLIAPFRIVNTTDPVASPEKLPE
jgi:hypothetical protein